MYVVFYTVNLCMYVHDFFHILLYLWHTYGSVECTYIYVCMYGVCVCVYVCVWVCVCVYVELFVYWHHPVLKMYYCDNTSNTEIILQLTRHL